MSAVPRAEWDALGGVSRHPFLSWAWLTALERTGCASAKTGWTPHHLTFWENGRLVAAAPAYVKEHSEGEFVFDHGWASAATRARIRYYPKLVVAVPFTPATGPRLLVRAGADRARLLRALAEGLWHLVETSKLSGAHVLFPEPAEAEALVTEGLAHRLGLQFQWHNRGYGSFDDFLARFSSKRRNQIRRERRALAEQGVRIETIGGSALDRDAARAVFVFYASTVAKFPWGRRYLCEAFFEEVCRTMPGSIELVLARRERGGPPIAGAFNLVGDGTLYGRYWGAIEEVPFLHFNVCYYAAIESCIARGFRRFEPGAGGEHKLVRGFEPTLTHSVHLLADGRLDRAVRDFLARERDAVREIAADGSRAFK